LTAPRERWSVGRSLERSGGERRGESSPRGGPSHSSGSSPLSPWALLKATSALVRWTFWTLPPTEQPMPGALRRCYAALVSELRPAAVEASVCSSSAGPGELPPSPCAPGARGGLTRGMPQRFLIMNAPEHSRPCPRGERGVRGGIVPPPHPAPHRGASLVPHVCLLQCSPGVLGGDFRRRRRVSTAGRASGARRCRGRRSSR